MFEQISKKENRAWHLTLGLVAILLGVWFVFTNISTSTGPTGTINGHTFKLEIAQNPQEQAQGLGGRESLARDTGMLFVNDDLAQRSFWMKDMNFPIDIIWMDEVYEVVEVTKNLSPDTYPQRFSATEQTQYVLEINAGLSDEFDIKTGDRLYVDIQQGDQ